MSPETLKLVAIGFPVKIALTLCHQRHKVTKHLIPKGNIMGKMDSSKGIPSTTGAKAPMGATSSDRTGERAGSVKGGVGQGMEDKTGSDKLFNTGKTSGVCYVKEKAAYR
jgi:hypothetical protein